MTAHYSTLQVRQALKRLGFSDNEIKVLIFLFYTKKANAKEISRETAIAFTSVQYCLSNLTARELVKIKPKEDDVFELVSEKEFFEWIDNAKQEHDMIYKRSKEEINTFFKIVQKKSWKPEVRYFEGREGIIEIYEDMLKSKNCDIYSWIDIQKIHDVLGEKYLTNFMNQRIKKNIRIHTIMPVNGINLKQKTGDEMKFVKTFPIEGEIHIYNEKVAVITFDREKPVGFLFQGGVMTNLFHTIFFTMWDNIK